MEAGAASGWGLLGFVPGCRTRCGRDPRLLLADDQTLVRHGFGMILRAEPGFDVAGEAGTGREAVALAAELCPDVVLMDVRMPELDGIEATRQIVTDASSPRVIVLTTFDSDEIVLGALRAGASGFLLKDALGDQLVAAIRIVAGGGSLFLPHRSPGGSSSVSSRSRPRSVPRGSTSSRRARTRSCGTSAAGTQTPRSRRRLS